MGHADDRLYWREHSRCFGEICNDVKMVACGGWGQIWTKES